MSLPSSSSLWGHVNSLANVDVGSFLGGNMKGLGNYCAVRLSYALIKCGHPIKRTSDYKDKNGNKYIIRTLTMEQYLNDYYKEGQKINSIMGQSGIVFFKDCGFGDAAGHVDVIVNGKVAHQDYSTHAKQIVLWKC